MVYCCLLVVLSVSMRPCNQSVHSRAVGRRHRHTTHPPHPHAHCTRRYIKQVWRQPYVNESLFEDPQTADGVADTNDGELNEETGEMEDQGDFWRHQRYCLDADCEDNAIIAL